MSLNFESLSNIAKGELLARVAHRLTVCARSTYQAGTAAVLEPEVLRAYNELLHRVIAAVSDYLLKGEGQSLQSIFKMMDDFGEQHRCPGYMNWAKGALASYTTGDLGRIN